MIRAVRYVLSTLALALGCLHMAVAIVGGGPSADGELWFVGTGAGIIAAGLLNLIALRTAPRDHFATGLTLVADLGFAGLFAWAYTRLDQPQVLVGIVLFLALAALALFDAQRRPVGS